jgi:hypothetical protein
VSRRERIIKELVVEPGTKANIFNHSHYEEVVALRVHPEWLDKQKLPAGPRGPDFWAERHEDINAFERHLDRSGTKVVKFFLHVSKGEQKRRFLARLDEPGKQWKFSAADLAERAHWNDYMRTFEEAVTATSTPWAPWYVVPADHKPVMQAMVAAILAGPGLSGGLGAGPRGQRRSAAQAGGRARGERLSSYAEGPSWPTSAGSMTGPAVVTRPMPAAPRWPSSA